MFYRKSVLDNGITVITERMSAVRSISLGFWFRVGSRDETVDEAGMSHFMEHMMFKGTPSRDAAAISQEFDALGAELNAFTSKEYTCYYARFVDEHLPKATEILSDMVINSSFAQECIDSEREVVIEEIARTEDTPDDYVYDLFTGALFPTHTLGKPILGTRDSVGGFGHADCSAYHDKHYTSQNCVVAAAGNVDHDALVALCEDYLSPMASGTINRRSAFNEPTRDVFSFNTKETEQAHVLYGMPGIPSGDDDRFAGALLDTVIGGGMSSRMFQEVREKRGLAYAVYSNTTPYQGAAQFSVYAGTRPSNLEEVVGIIDSELKKVVQKGVTAEELQRVREYVTGTIILSMESTRTRMTRLGKNAVTDIEQLSIEEVVANYRAITLEDIDHAAKRVLTQQPTLAVISPYSTDELDTMFSYLKARA